MPSLQRSTEKGNHHKYTVSAASRYLPTQVGLARLQALADHVYSQSQCDLRGRFSHSNSCREQRKLLYCIFNLAKGHWLTSKPSLHHFLPWWHKNNWYLIRLISKRFFQSRVMLCLVCSVTKTVCSSVFTYSSVQGQLIPRSDGPIQA